MSIDWHAVWLKKDPRADKSFETADMRAIISKKRSACWPLPPPSPPPPVICSLPLHMGGPSLSDIFESHITFQTLRWKRSNPFFSVFFLPIWEPESSLPACLPALAGMDRGHRLVRIRGRNLREIFILLLTHGHSHLTLCKQERVLLLFLSRYLTCATPALAFSDPAIAELISDGGLRVYLYCCSARNETRVGLTATHLFSQQAYLYALHCSYGGTSSPSQVRGVWMQQLK